MSDARYQSDRPGRFVGEDRRKPLRYRERRPDETLAEYNARMAKGHSVMSQLMHRTRHPEEYD